MNSNSFTPISLKLTNNFDNKSTHFQTSSNILSNSNSSPNIYDRDKNEIFNILSPHIDSIFLKEENLNKMLNDAQEFKEQIERGKTKLVEDTKDYLNKKNKLRYVYHALYEFRNKLLKKEKELKLKEEQLRQYDINIKTNDDIVKENFERFQKYIEDKTEELKNEANKIKNLKELNDEKDVQLIKREQDCNLREKNLRIAEEQFRNKYNDVRNQGKILNEQILMNQNLYNEQKNFQEKKNSNNLNLASIKNPNNLQSQRNNEMNNQNILNKNKI